MRSQKRILALTVVSAVLFSSMGMAVAAEPIEKDFLPGIMVMEEGKEGTEEGTQLETSKETAKETAAETLEETAKETTAETLEERTEKTEAETSGEAESETVPETSGETETENIPEISGETETENAAETSGETETENIPEISGETEAENPKGNFPEASGNESSPALPKPDLKPSINSIPDIHKHSWSADWNYDGACHWHECDGKDCPAAENSEKEGYGEHNYDDYGVCTDCGFDAMEGIAVTSLGDVPTYQEAYDAMAALKEEYPEGMKWTNFEPYGSKGELGDAYTWNGGAVYGAKSAVGCMAFAFILSDEAFGNLPARVMEKGSFTFEDVKIGDILRINNNSHSVIVLRKSAGGVTVAEAIITVLSTGDVL